MKRTLALALLVTSGFVGGGSLTAASAAAESCQGKPVTIVGNLDVRTGTEGDDVVWLMPGNWYEFDARGGNDTICVNKPVTPTGPEPYPPAGRVDAGAGDDLVVNLWSNSATGTVTAGLGAGNDTFLGSNVGEHVFADSRADDGTTRPTGPSTDVITMGGGTDWVETMAPEGGPNQDRIVFGGGEAKVAYTGPMGAGATLDLGDATTGELQLPQPGLFGPGEVVVDNAAREVRTQAGVALRWLGDVTRFMIERVPVPQPAPATVSFAGSDLGEYVEIAGLVGDIRLAGGDDHFNLQNFGSSDLPRSLDGGQGTDLARLPTACSKLRIDLSKSMTCSEGASRTTHPFAGFEDVGSTILNSTGKVVLVGTPAADRLVASAPRVRLEGRGGDDDLDVDDAWHARVRAGSGADQVYAQAANLRVWGGKGADRIRLDLLTIAPFGGKSPKKKVLEARGGAGRDRLIGSSTGVADRLIGGRGSDHADGRAGKRDYCVAEKTVRCERP